jgi:hypothetical protein
MCCDAKHILSCVETYHMKCLCVFMLRVGCLMCMQSALLICVYLIFDNMMTRLQESNSPKAATSRTAARLIFMYAIFVCLRMGGVVRRGRRQKRLKTVVYRGLQWIASVW